jgi:hypothetical protein
MQKNLFFIFLIIANMAIAQNVEIVGKGNFSFEEKPTVFAFLEAKTDTMPLQYVASIKATAPYKKATIGDLFFKIKNQAQTLGANCFRLKSYSNDTVNITMVLDTYFADDSLLYTNLANHEKNAVFIFCSDRISDEKYAIKVNNVKKEFVSGTYLKFLLFDGQKLKLNKGGLTGETMWFNYENKTAVFLATNGFGINGASPPGTVGLSFNTGRFNYIDKNLGHLLAQVLKQSE